VKYGKPECINYDVVDMFPILCDYVANKPLINSIDFL